VNIKSIADTLSYYETELPYLKLHILNLFLLLQILFICHTCI